MDPDVPFPLRSILQCLYSTRRLNLAPQAPLTPFAPLVSLVSLVSLVPC
jgi:hypothetical protein